MRRKYIIILALIYHNNINDDVLHVVEFCCGICDITTRNRNDRTIDLPFDSSDDILVYVMAKINDCIRSVKGGASGHARCVLPDCGN